VHRFFIEAEHRGHTAVDGRTRFGHGLRAYLDQA
jgi:hypothetical protein